MLVIVALMSIVIFGAAALAIDGSLQTHNRRNLQNWTDGAALSGARDLPTDPTTAVKDALQVIQQNSPWSTVTTWASSAPTGSCTSSSCVVTNYAGPAGYTTYSVSVSSPPSTPQDAVYSTTNYIEVEARENITNSLGAIIHSGTSTNGGHSIGYNRGAVGPYQYTFFAKLEAGSGNQQETVNGDAFVGTGYTPQSSGQAGLCVYELPGPETATTDTDGDIGGTQDNDLDDLGHLTFSAVPPAVGPNPTYGASGVCPGSGQLTAQATTPQSSAPTNCPLGSTPQSYNSGANWACVQAAPVVPAILSPTVTATLPCVGGAGTVTTATLPGVYSVAAGCAVTVDFSAGNVDCVSLVLGTGASVTLNNKKGSNYMSAYGFNPSGDTTATNAIAALPQPVPTTACGGSTNNFDRSVIWAADPGAGTCTSSASCPIALSNLLTGCCSDSLFIGTVFLPNQQIAFSTNQAMEDVGTVYCGDWEVQSGNHPNPMVSYDNNAAAFVVGGVRLVE